MVQRADSSLKIALTATPSEARFAPILWRGPVAGAFDLAHRLGYDGVELHLRSAGDASLAELRSLQARYRLGIPTLGTGMAAGEDGLTFSHPDPETRRRAIDYIGEHIRLAAGIGSAVTIGLIRGRIGQGKQRGRGWCSVLECLGACCRMAEAEGVTLLLEPVNRYEGDDLNRLDQAAAVIQEVGSPCLRILADTFHMNVEEVDIAGSLRQHAALLGHVHLVDSNREAPGHGHLDIRSILQVLEAADYDCYVCFEVLPLPDRERAADDGIRTVRKVLRDFERPPVQLPHAAILGRKSRL
jgi:sugar phosphate isomerase/epimerase